MADRLDVAERLAEGRVAVEHTQAYVRACQTLGYEHPDLTSHPSQIRDWFGSEDGLDLYVLDRDCARLRAAGAAVAEGIRIQHDQVGELSAAWTGVGSDAAVAFLQRHCDAATMVANEVRAAAQRCESLRDNLWHLLDSKVGTAIAIDDRSQAHRSAWLAAAAVVTAGSAERSTAEQVVHGQITPYVDNDIRNDWLTAMRSSLSAFGTAYDMVNDRMRAAPAAYFDTPGDLGPGFQPSPPVAPQPVPPPVATAPAAVVPSGAADPAPATPASAPAAIPTPPAPPAPPLSDLATPLSDLGAGLGNASALPTGAGGLGDLGGGAGGLGGLSGLAGQIVDAIGGLLGSATDGLGDPSDPLGKDPFDDDTSDEDPFHPDDVHDDADKDPENVDAEKAAAPKEAAQAQPVDPPAGTPPLPVGEQPPASAPTPAATPVPAAAPPTPATAPAPAAAPPTDGSTPCEIAADQVPQAGQ
ncbi:hypothetical protein AWC05_00950 [Mycobacterium florentinum]|uniref:Uncharacterized protein n=1 Tax=Mycobacterium florentinum TaxID=292462 RepID=A0A1X1TZ85_MYCFL|nr:hypothetical protein [Mycobacterium florentinum]MCV7409195.1 hypothetical protein [Mycobacterium florentinum]ORV49718.1 hypothetical protein AWC05_00950 [Mycobacterium florentinum]BBX78682.1 hypothetical protein MFLOJ_24690 [Mycobacterium florentinum]